MTEIITYETLYESLRKEKYKKELQHLDKDFYKKVKKYIEEKKEILCMQEDTNSPFSNQVLKLRKQIENIQKMLKELYERRESKITQLALFSSRTNKETVETEEMLDEEISFYKETLRNFNNHRKKILHDILEELCRKPKQIKTPALEKNESDSEEIKLKSVKLLQEIPAFVGEDLNTYGPFKESDIAEIPENVADLLIKNNKAQEL